MTPEGSVTQWIQQVRAGDQEAAENLWRRYFQELVGIARRRVVGRARLAEDEEDLALIALQSFFDGARRGRFPQLKDRQSLWPLLVSITEHKVLNLYQREFAQKRGAGKVRGDSGADFAQVADVNSFAPNPTDKFAAEVCGNCRELLESLHNETLQVIALRRLEGYTIDEIAKELGCVRRTIDRKLDRIRAIWQEQLKDG